MTDHDHAGDNAAPAGARARRRTEPLPLPHPAGRQPELLRHARTGSTSSASCSRPSSRSSPTPPTRRSAASRTAPSSTGWRRRSSSSSPFGYSGGPCSHGIGRARPLLRRLRIAAGSTPAWPPPACTTSPRRPGLRRRPDHPYVHVVGVVLTPLRKFCASPVLPRVRAILSWQARADGRRSRLRPGVGRGPGGSHPDPPPPSLLPGRHPRRDRAGRARSTRRRSTSSSTSTCCRSPIPEPDPIGPVALNPQPLPPGTRTPTRCRSRWSACSRIYSPDKLKVLAKRALDDAIARLALEEVPAHRLAAAEVVAGAVRGDRTGRLAGDVARLRQARTSTGRHWSTCSPRARATRRTRSWSASGSTTTPASSSRPTASSGRPGSPGRRAAPARRSTSRSGPTSTTTAVSTYLGTVAVAAHDYITMPAGGLSYAAVLPARRQRLPAAVHEPGLHRVRAVLSWNTPPSTTDPDAGARTGATGSTPTSTCCPAAPTTASPG